MQLTRPNRKRLYGVAFAILWLLILASYWGMTDIEKHDAPSGRTYSSITTCSLGPVQWLGITAHHYAMPLGVVTTRKYDFHLSGILFGILLSVLTGWLLWRWWGKAVIFYRLPSNICDACAYDLSGETGNYCPECGEVSEKPNAHSPAAGWISHWRGFIIVLMFALAVYGIHGPLMLLFITDLIPILSMPILLGAMVLPFLMIFILVLFIFAERGKNLLFDTTYKGKQDTPRIRQRVCLAVVWSITALVLAGLAVVGLVGCGRRRRRS
ncbi:MAG: hypothetical protein IID15_08755 [Candidatus Marinimicrobia bacterium]|nr:hypothetical protein [Candidatus Neomarinimicrobiota bacterium]